MKYLYYKNIKKLKNLNSDNFEFIYIKLKYFLYNTNFEFFIRQRVLNLLNNLFLYKKSFVSIKFRCFLTNKGRSCFNYFKISRIKLRMLNSYGLLNGIKKAS
jgi:ribosomal protein S14